MALSERSKFVRVQAAWINYQEKYLQVQEHLIQTTPPKQFSDIFWLGFDYGRSKAEI